MNVEDILDELVKGVDDNGPKGFSSFSTFVINLFKYHVKSKDLDLLVDKSVQPYADFYIPGDLDDLVGGTFFEIKGRLPKLPSNVFFKNFKSRIDLMNRFNKGSYNYVFIVAQKVTKIEERRFKNFFGVYDPSVNIVLWGTDELKKIARKNKNEALLIYNKLFSLRISKAVDESSSNWKKNREKIISEITEVYQKGQFSLFLGAGVSSSAGMPSWDKLMRLLFADYLTNEFISDPSVKRHDIENLVDRLNVIDAPSALMSARYLRKGLVKDTADKLEFAKSVSRILYESRDKAFKLSSDLMVMIASMCRPTRNGAKIKSVITYNFDDLLEIQLSYKSIDHRSIFLDGESYAPEELPVYHVHGFLPQNRKIYDGIDNSLLVFSEEGYHAMYLDPYHWSNLVQLNSLRENNCLMIGLSMTDPNLRRLLEVSSKNLEIPKHYAFMQRMTLQEFCRDKASGEVDLGLVSNKNAAEEFIERHSILNEQLMKELGVTVIWFEDYDEIPSLIKEFSAC